MHSLLILEQEKKNNYLIAGDIYLKYGETSALGINGAMPSSTYPSASEHNYFQFQITGKNTHETGNVLYKLKLAYGDNTTDRLNKIDDQYLYFKLVEVNGNTEKIVVNDANFTTIPNSTLYVDTIPNNTTTEIVKTYRLYMRISENVGIGTNTTYTQDAWNKLYASVKINAEGKYITGDIASKKIISRYNGSGQDGLVAVNTNGDLYTGTGEIREYRYSGGGRYCEYQNGTTTYKLQVEGNECPATAVFGGGPPSLYTTTADIRNDMGGTLSGTTYTRTTNTVQETNLKNYIYFNYDRWRIVGIVDGNIKIVKDLPITTANAPTTYNNIAGTIFNIKNESGNFANNKYAVIYWNSNTYRNDWGTAGGMHWSNEDNENSYYNTINAPYKSMIDTKTYYLSNVSVDSAVMCTARTLYNQERANPVECSSGVTQKSHNNSCNIWNGNSATWIGKIALLYPSDFGYASASGNWSKNITSYYQIGTVVSDNWLLNNDASYNWFLSPSSGTVNYNIMWYGNGRIQENNSNNFAAWRPVLYLKSDTLIVSGDGSYEHPYQLDLA